MIFLVLSNLALFLKDAVVSLEESIMCPWSLREVGGFVRLLSQSELCFIMPADKDSLIILSIALKRIPDTQFYIICGILIFFNPFMLSFSLHLWTEEVKHFRVLMFFS